LWPRMLLSHERFKAVALASVLPTRAPPVGESPYERDGTVILWLRPLRPLGWGVAGSQNPVVGRSGLASFVRSRLRSGLRISLERKEGVSGALKPAVWLLAGWPLRAVLGAAVHRLRTARGSFVPWSCDGRCGRAAARTRASAAELASPVWKRFTSARSRPIQEERSGRAGA
jgi:hypothetical protein